MSIEVRVEGQPDKRYFYFPLAQRVLAVAVVTTSVGDWTAYIDAVPGQLHKNEVYAVVYVGDKLPENLAETLFPDIAERYVWRR